jgi:subtilisin family serine protease
MLGMTACGQVPLRPSAALPPPAASGEARPTHVVVTVRNRPWAPNAHAASTARGYGGQGPYRASAEALAAARRIAADHGLDEVAAWPIELLGVHCLVYAAPARVRREDLLAALRRDPDVESAQELVQFELRTAAYNDPYAGLQANLADLDVHAAQRWSRGEGVRIAVIDTGIDTVHPDFGGRLGRVRDFVADGASSAEAHGTAVAGVIAALPNNGIGIAGIAPAATLLPLRACWSSAGGVGACNSFTLAQALAAAGAAQAAVVNLSLGGPPDPLLTRIVERLLSRGTVIVGAVPASGRREGFPTAIPGVIAVDATGPLPATPLVLYAPGNEVFTLTPFGRYDVASGSSIAAAEVSAVVALLLAHEPRPKGAEIGALLGRSSGLTAAAQGTLRASVNACAALQELRPGAVCTKAAAAVARGP